MLGIIKMSKKVEKVYTIVKDRAKDCIPAIKYRVFKRNKTP